MKYLMLALAAVCMFCPPCDGDVCADGCYVVPCQHHVGRVVRERADHINASGSFHFTPGQEDCNMREGRRTQDIQKWLQKTHTPYY